jgi:hypothetical protein
MNEQESREALLRLLGWHGEGPCTNDTYDGDCPECGGFAIFWQPDVEAYIADPDAVWICENGHRSK